MAKKEETKKGPAPVDTWEFWLLYPATYTFRGKTYKRGHVYTTTSRKLVESLPGIFRIRKVTPKAPAKGKKES